MEFNKAQLRAQDAFFALSESFRDASDPEEVTCLGDKLGRMIFGADDAGAASSD